ncbi:hypothetical protein C8R44DRAFT_741206 [Mycena epipterygia]|nr:hypothetical protein C8R44DRAFT_741206 [Mycena epipterygia]
MATEAVTGTGLALAKEVDRDPVVHVEGHHCDYQRPPAEAAKGRGGWWLSRCCFNPPVDFQTFGQSAHGNLAAEMHGEEDEKTLAGWRMRRSQYRTELKQLYCLSLTSLSDHHPAMPPKPKPTPTGPVLPALPMRLRAVRQEHPGMPDMKKTKCSSEEVQQEKQAKDDKKKMAEDKWQQDIVTSMGSRTKILGPRPKKKDDLPRIYQADAPDDSVFDPSEDETAGTPALKPGGRTRKPAKGAARKAVDAERLKQGDGAAPAKRKAVPAEQVILLPHAWVLIIPKSSSNVHSGKKIKETPIGRLRVNWERGRTPLPDAVDCHSCSKSAGSTMDVDRNYNFSDAGYGADPPGSDSNQDDGDEADAMADEKGKTARTKAHFDLKSESLLTLSPIRLLLSWAL